MMLRIFVGLIVLAALVVGILAVLGVALPRNMVIVQLIVFRDFFDVSLPILAFGALIKYLCTWSSKCNCGK